MAIRPRETPSQPVWRSIRRQPAGSNTSPFPKTGMRSACLTRPMYSQRAGRARRSGATRGWKVTASAPAASKPRARLTAACGSSCQPVRNFTVTGTATARRTRSTMRIASSGSRSSAAPQLRLQMVVAAQPKLRSTPKNPSAAMRSAAAAISAGSQPMIWQARCGSSAARQRKCLDTAGFSVGTVRALHISEKNSPQPPKRSSSSRKATCPRNVIGAKTSRFAMVRAPIASGRFRRVARSGGKG